MTTETKPTAPAQHLKVVHTAHIDSFSIYTFDDGSVWERSRGEWQCAWQPTTHMVPIDRKALVTLLAIASAQKQLVRPESIPSLDYAIDAAKEALGGIEL